MTHEVESEKVTRVYIDSTQDFLDGSSRLWMGLGVKEEKDEDNETPAAAGEITKMAVKKEASDNGEPNTQNRNCELQFLQRNHPSTVGGSLLHTAPEAEVGLI